MPMINVLQRFNIQLHHETFTRTYEVGEQDLPDHAAEVALREKFGVKVSDENTKSKKKDRDNSGNRAELDEITTDYSAKTPSIIPGFGK